MHATVYQEAGRRRLVAIVTYYLSFRKQNIILQTHNCSLGWLIAALTPIKHQKQEADQSALCYGDHAGQIINLRVAVKKPTNSRALTSIESGPGRSSDTPASLYRPGSLGSAKKTFQGLRMSTEHVVVSTNLTSRDRLASCYSWTHNVCSVRW